MTKEYNPSEYHLEDLRRPISKDELQRRMDDIRFHEDHLLNVEKEQSQSQLNELHINILAHPKNSLQISLDCKKYHVLNQFNQHVKQSQDNVLIQMEAIGTYGWLIITTKGVYRLTRNVNVEADDAEEFIINPVYQFYRSLHLKQTQLLLNLLDTIATISSSHPTDISMRAAHVESIIRFIPGSYSNGPWKQINGFFGPYINEQTMEISTIPPQV